MGNKYRKQLEEQVEGLLASLDDEMLRDEHKRRNRDLAWIWMERLQTMDNEDLDKN